MHTLAITGQVDLARGCKTWRRAWPIHWAAPAQSAAALARRGRLAIKLCMRAAAVRRNSAGAASVRAARNRTARPSSGSSCLAPGRVSGQAAFDALALLFYGGEALGQNVLETGR